jgi:hypothetical protein
MSHRREHLPSCGKKVEDVREGVKREEPGRE